MDSNKIAHAIVHAASLARSPMQLFRTSNLSIRSKMQLETDRLLIRPFEPSDEEAAIAFFTDPDFMVFSIDGALTREGARAKLGDLIALYEAHGFSKLALVEKGGGRVVGYCGFGLEPIDGQPQPEFGYRLRRDARGRGLATEAARAVAADAFARLKMDFVQSMVMEENTPSRRVLEKLGMRYQRRVLFGGRELLLYRLDAPGSGSRL